MNEMIYSVATENGRQVGYATIGYLPDKYGDELSLNFVKQSRVYLK